MSTAEIFIVCFHTHYMTRLVLVRLKHRLYLGRYLDFIGSAENP